MKYFKNRILISVVFCSIIVGLVLVRSERFEEQAYGSTGEFVECMNRVNGSLVGHRDLNDWDEAYAQFGLGSSSDKFQIDDFASIMNFLGHHPTWTLVVDERSNTPVFYETYDPNTGYSVLFRGSIPKRVIRAAEICGAVFGGLITSDIREVIAMRIALLPEQDQFSVGVYANRIDWTFEKRAP